MYSIGFIGCGNMGGALASAASKNCNSMALADADKAKREALAQALHAEETDNVTIARESRVIVLGVKPQILPAVLEEIAPVLKKRNDDYLIVTMAAGVSIKTLCEKIGSAPHVIRIMPNTPAAIGEGMILFTCGEGVTDNDVTLFKTIFASAGELEEIEERLIDAGSAVSGCGPAFVYMFIDALADGGVKAGLPRDKALRLAAKTVSGSADMVLLSGKHPEALKNAVCSPAGSTIEGVNVLENAAFRAAVMSAVTAAYKRTKELGKS